MAYPSIGVAVITHTAAKQLPRNLPPLLNSPLKPRVIVVNSTSNDGTVEVAQRMGAETLVVPRNEFNHGQTREIARKALGTDIIVMITPDAILLDSEQLTHLIQPMIKDAKIGLSYARQIPHDDAGYFESFPRHFNYPEKSEIRSAADIERYGAATFFCSDSCAAWSNAALDAIGGFQPTLTAEDAIAAAKLIYAGYKIAYTADALVKHSHRYSLRQEFQRYFDIGYMRRENCDLFFRSGRDEARGASFLRAMLADLTRSRPYLIPYALLATATKYAGYKVGGHSRSAPTWLNARLSGQDYYWKSIYADR